MPSYVCNEPSVELARLGSGIGMEETRNINEMFINNLSVRMVDLYLQSPICFHVVVLNQLSTWTTLPYRRTVVSFESVARKNLKKITFEY
jgi:hypothetical protein